jgi:thiol reductant ABC exporter CydC subunit
MSAELVEVLRGAPELAVHGAAPEALARVAAADGQLARTGRRQALAGGLGDAIVVAAAGLTTAAVLAACISASASGSLDPVLIAAVALLALGSFEAVAPLVATTRELPTVLAAGGRVLGLLDRRAAVVDPEEPLPLPPGPAVVALEKVTARYPGATEPVLRGFGLVLQPGRHVALLGPSGAGKTTVTSLLLRFLDPEQGRVTIGGVDIRRLSQRDVRSTFALAGQEAHLFDSTIRENLRLARPQASDDDLWHALALAQLDGWVQTLPDGLDTFVGEEGRRLSGGQRQRLVIARALLTDAPVLLLDEPTAHLDTRTAQELVEDVLAHAGDRAVLLVTHRREGLDLVDEIVTL